MSTVPLLSSEWGAREVLGDLVALLAAWGVWAIVVPPPALPPSLVSRATPPPTMTFGHTTSLAQSRKRFLLSYSIVIGFLHLLVFLFLLHLWDIIMALHLWRLCLHSLLCRGPWRPLSHDHFSESSASEQTMSFPPHCGVPTAVPSAQPLRLLLMCLLLLLGWRWLVSGFLLWFLLLHWLLLPRWFLFGLRKLSSFPSSRISRHTWTFMT